MKKPSNATFQKERKNTDQSLGLEREKTNRSITEARNKIEKQTDKSVQENRSTADQSTEKSRNSSDAFRENNEKYSTSEKFFTANARRVADAAILQERHLVDAAIDREREIVSNIESTLLRSERQETDLNLAEERTSTDSVLLSGSTRLTEEMSEHSKTKATLTTRDEFLSIVSHDLKNPISAISSCMEMLLEEAEEREIDSETKTWLDLAKRNADSSLRLIRDILDMERIAQGKLTLDIYPCNIGNLVKEVMESFVHAAAAKNILLRLVSFPTKTLDCDRDRLSQVLSNLIGNALKFTPEGGKIILKSKETDTDVTISVCDTGEGIPQEKKLLIFNKFAQIESKDRRGLGLGLHISKTLVESHGGILWVESTVGEGSVFSLKIPYTPTIHVGLTS